MMAVALLEQPETEDQAIPVVIQAIRLDDITTNAGTQVRERLFEPMFQEYADEIKGGAVFPPLDVFTDGDSYWLADGFHRWHAARLAGLKEFLCRVHEGTLEDAVLFALQANASHGLRRTPSDKRRAVMKMLRHKVWCRWSDRRIAQQCHVTGSFVASMRRTCDNPMAHSDFRLTKRANGKEVLVDTSKVVGRPPKTETAKEAPSFLTFVRFLERRGDKPVPHTKTPLGLSCIATTKAVFLYEPAINQRMFRSLVADALFCRASLDGKKDAYVAGTAVEDLSGWYEIAEKLGVRFMRYPEKSK